MSRLDIMELAGDHSIILYDFFKQTDNEAIGKIIQERPLQSIIEELNDFYTEGQKSFEYVVQERKNNMYKIESKKEESFECEL